MPASGSRYSLRYSLKVEGVCLGPFRHCGHALSPFKFFTLKLIVKNRSE